MSIPKKIGGITKKNTSPVNPQFITSTGALGRVLTSFKRLSWKLPPEAGLFLDREFFLRSFT